ncbi:metallophosphoesterase family protein [Metabacillus arenae]|uniref:Metallophosphoesterase n=1 Tax=Metabacillus arenae TaxID=2771434 RepID=A0A926RXT7_9BACI|nr:metallophosphoesterase [Metabacillus arenae]MBD1380492.1 metallophosphoesterase [Metabacillus arenae]
MEPIYFIHLTDTHIISPRKGFLFNVDVITKLHLIFDAVKELSIKPQFVVISGDLTHDGDVEDYQFLKELLNEKSSELGIPVFTALGNHDSREVFREGYLSEEPTAEPYYYEKMIGELRLIVLDSQIPGRVGGHIDKGQLDWLASILQTPAPAGTILMFHHPILPTISPRTTLLLNREELATIIEDSDVIGILTGHIHYNSIGEFHGITSLTGAGTGFGFDPTTKDSIRVLDNSGFNFIMVKDRRMMVSPMSIPSTHKEMFRLPIEVSRKISS